MKILIRLLLIIGFTSLILNACGYRGPLYLPDPASTPQTIHVTK